MAFRAALLNFSKGEIAPELEARFDVDSYKAGLRQALNVKIRRYGGVEKRMGTRYVSETFVQDSDVRVLPFQFNLDQAYALEMGQAYMRPAALGGLVLEEGLEVTAITKAANAQITAAFHDYAVGDQVYLEGILGMAEINGRFLTVATVIDDDNFTVDHDTSGYGTFTGSGGGTARVGPPDPPPAPPVVPPVATPPEEPVVGSGSWGGYDVDGEWWRYFPTGSLFF